MVEAEDGRVEEHEETDRKCDHHTHGLIGWVEISRGIEREHGDHADPRKDLHGEERGLATRGIVALVRDDFLYAPTQCQKDERANHHGGEGNEEVFEHE